MKVSQLRSLVAVADHNSFWSAAMALHISQSAVSHAIASLEDELGVILLSRGRYGARLTPVGERVVGYARQVLSLLDDITKEAHLARGLQTGQVRITSFRSVASHLLPEVVVQFRQRFPDISVSVVEHESYPEVEDDLRQGRADIGITAVALGQEFETWALSRDEFIVLCPPTFELQGDRLTWEQMMAQPLIMALDDNVDDQQVYAHCQQFGAPLQATYRFRTDSTIVNMVAQGLGMTIIPRLAAEPIPTDVQIYSLPVPMVRIIRVAVLAEALHVPAVFAFLDLLKGSKQSPSQTLL